MEHLSDLVAEQLDKSGSEARFTSQDMQYTCGQTPLDKNAVAQCNFQIIGGEATGTYTIITGFDGLTTMPTEFQRIMNKIL